MSADKRKTILIAFAGLAVVLVAVIFVVSPSFKSEDATGAIGAVQKHRAPQIAKTDVILGSEQQRHQQNVLYADYLKDAAALQSFAVGVKTNEAQARTGIQADIAAKQHDVGLRFTQDVVMAVETINKLAVADEGLSAKRASIIAQADALAAKARAAFDTLDAKQMRAIGLQLRDIEAEVGVKQQNIEMVEMKNADGVKNTLDAIDRNEFAMLLRGESDYALALADQEALLVEAKNARGAQFRDAAAKLEAKAAENMKAALVRDQDTIEVLGKMTSLEAKNAYGQRIAATQARAQNDMRLQYETLRSFVDHAATLNLKLRSDITEQIGALAENKTSIGESDTFAVQTQALLQKARGLEARSK